jgi:hypothetical protein
MLVRHVLSFAARFAILGLMSYGLLYFSYKYYIPWYGGSDFIEYYKMYVSPLDFSAAHAPWVYRQLSAILTHAVYKSGLYYNDVISFHDQAYDQHILFAALLTNFVCLLLTATIVGSSVERLGNGGRVVYPLLAGLLCITSFMSQTAVITGLTEGVTWLLVAALVYFYLRESSLPAVAVLLAISIFQREMIAVMFGALACFSLVFRRGARRYQAAVLLFSVASFCAYVLVRKSLLPVSGGAYEDQLSVSYMLHAVQQFHPTNALILQGMISQNVLILCLLSSFFLILIGGRTARIMWVSLLTWAVLAGISILEGIGGNLGRIAGAMTPLFAIICTVTLQELEYRIPLAGQTSHSRDTSRGLEVPNG